MSSIVPSATAQALIKGEREDSIFTLFPKLPLELRRMLWKFALPGPRMIRILPSVRFIVQENGKCVLNPEWRQMQMAGSKAASPVILRVNHEARETGLSTYKLAFKGRLSKPIYFDFAQDSLFFANEEVSNSFVWMSLSNSSAVDREYSRVDMGSVRHIVVGVDDTPDILIHRQALYWLLPLVRLFPGLQVMGLAGDNETLKRNGVTTPDAITDKCKRDWAEHRARRAARTSLVYAIPNFTWIDLGDVEEQCKRGNYVIQKL
ncbi:hypothetical protein BKA61DRAFT_708432 [Leptodontidium sp. MPI-SDFR-AT-0119]|nr:hypothetical protein BKA61DRAFT_708432 [Leptodontidium sp. MPI-SDFR-AT-0119]